METKTISLPRLDGLTPTLESTALKLMEEAGELARLLVNYGDERGKDNGRRAGGGSGYNGRAVRRRPDCGFHDVRYGRAFWREYWGSFKHAMLNSTAKDTW